MPQEGLGAKDLKKVKDNACNGAGGCLMRMCCPELGLRLQKAQQCSRLRQRITLECYGGQTDDGHIQRISDALRAAAECKRIMNIKCTGQPQ